MAIEEQQKIIIEEQEEAAQEMKKRTKQQDEENQNYEKQTSAATDRTRQFVPRCPFAQARMGEVSLSKEGAGGRKEQGTKREGDNYPSKK